MIEIYPVAYDTLLKELAGLAQSSPALWNEMTNNGCPDSIEPPPFIQISYDELTGEEIDRLLGFDGIPKSNVPLGFVGAFDAFSLQQENNEEILIFPIHGLYSYFKEVAPDIFMTYEKCSSMDAFVDIRGDELSAKEYLAACRT